MEYIIQMEPSISMMELLNHQVEKDIQYMEQYLILQMIMLLEKVQQMI